MARPELIFLCGFSGSGKTKSGAILAEKLKMGFTDTDAIIEESMGRSIPEIFAKFGEGKFRFAESDVIRMAIKRKPQVISLGGGAIADKNNLDFIKAFGYLIYLKVSPETVYARLQHSHFRPVLETVDGESDLSPEEAVKSRISDLIAERETNYLQADLVIDTEKKTPEEVADEMFSKLNGND
jgi:shikimate kinase